MNISSVSALPTIASVSNPKALITQYQGVNGLGIGTYLMVPVDPVTYGEPAGTNMYGPTTDEPVSYNNINVTQIADRSTGDFMDELNSLGSSVAIMLSDPVGYADSRINNMGFDMSAPGYGDELDHLAALGQQDVQTKLDALFKQQDISNSPPVTFKVVDTNGTLSVQAQGDQQDQVNQLLAANPDLQTRIRTALDLAEQARSFDDMQEANNKMVDVGEEKGFDAAKKFSVESMDFPQPKATFSYGADGLATLFNDESTQQWQSVYDMFLNQLEKTA